MKILKFFSDTFKAQELTKMINEKDFQGLDAIEYAKLTERPEILDMVEKMKSGLKVEIPSNSNEENDETI